MNQLWEPMCLSWRRTNLAISLVTGIRAGLAVWLSDFAKTRHRYCRLRSTDLAPTLHGLSTINEMRDIYLTAKGFEWDSQDIERGAGWLG